MSAPALPLERQAPEYLVLGEIVAPFGIRGEVKVLLDTDFPELVLEAAYLYVGDPPLRYEVEWARPHKKLVRLKLLGCDDRNSAENLRGQLLQVAMAEAPVPEQDEYYYHELIGLQVWTEQDEYLGEVEEVWPTGSNQVLLVKGRQGELLLPAIDSVVREVDLAQGRILVHLLEGLR
ncbi:MAG: 16S rRNA processing protein RimM [Chloroflexia bacterium]|nr:16S rRNA processing protein RimM [Chloroflexia bacterium]